MRWFIALLFCALASPPALAVGGSSGTGAGEIPCERDAEKVQEHLDAQAGQRPADQVHEMRQQLEVARLQCQQSLNDGETTLQRLRQELATAPSRP